MSTFKKISKVVKDIAKKTAPGAVRNVAMKRARIGAPAINPSIKTRTPKNAEGELINPTNKDVKNFNKKFTTTRPTMMGGAISEMKNKLLNKSIRKTSDGYMKR